MSDFVLVSVYDNVTRRWSMPQAQDNEDSAKRWFKYIVKNSDMIAEDLSLHFVGTFNQDTGIILAVEEPIKIFDFSEVEDNEKV